LKEFDLDVSFENDSVIYMEDVNDADIHDLDTSKETETNTQNSAN